MRFTVKHAKLFALLLDPRPGVLELPALGRTAAQGAIVAKIERVGGGPVPFEQTDEALRVMLKEEHLGGPVPVLALMGEGVA